ncbi:MAG TPA: hypothetical protein HPP56_00490 [Nitrospirae bacterium]|nr:hypothetical protein [Nitrospirota bacterium]
MKKHLYLSVFLVVIFLCGCAGGRYYSNYYPCYQQNCENYYSDCINKSYYYSYSDDDWHNPICSDKLYSYIKIKKNDFPVAYRSKNQECCLKITPSGYCIPGKC